MAGENIIDKCIAIHWTSAEKTNLGSNYRYYM
jgi:hypothetical protein